LKSKTTFLMFRAGSFRAPSTASLIRLITPPVIGLSTTTNTPSAAGAPCPRPGSADNRTSASAATGTIRIRVGVTMHMGLFPRERQRWSLLRGAWGDWERDRGDVSSGGPSPL